MTAKKAQVEMVRGIAEPRERTEAPNADRQELEKLLELSFSKAGLQPVGAAGKTPEPAALSSEEDLLREAILALRALRYGSVLLVIHEGHLVEITKTVRIRRSPAAAVGKAERK